MTGGNPHVLAISGTMLSIFALRNCREQVYMRMFQNGPQALSA
jgi:hypothetical protein